MAPSDKQPIQFAQRMSQLPPYLFGMINQMKMEKRWKGDDVIDLGMGNPVDPAPEPVITKLLEAANDPKTHRYPVAYGMRNLRIELAKSYQKDYSVTLDPDSEVLCTIGSKEGIGHIPLAFVNRWVACALYVAVAILWLVPDRRIERALAHRRE